MALFDVQKALAAGMTADQISVYMTQNKLKPLQSLPVAPAKKKRSGLASLLPLLGSIGGGLLGAPLGPAGIIGGGAAGGALGEFGAQKLSGEDTNLGSIGKEAAFSGISGGVGMGALKLLSRGVGPVARGVGNELTQGTLRTGVKAGANTAEELASQAALKNALKLKGSPAAIAGKIAGKKVENRETIKALLSLGDKVDKNTLKATIQQDLNNHTYSGFKEFQNSGKAFLGTLNKRSNTNLDLLKFRDEIFPLIKSGSTAHEKQAAKVVYDGINTALKGTGDEVGSLINTQAQLYGLEETYSKAAAKGVNIPFLGSSQIASRPVGGIRDLMARATSGLGNQAPRGALGNAATAAAQQGVGRPLAGALGFGNQQQPMDQGMGQQPDMQSLLAQTPPTQADTGLPSQGTEDMGEKLKMAALLDLAAGGKNVTKLLALAKAFEKPKMGEAQAGQVSQIQAANGLVDQLEQTFGTAQSSGQTGFGVGPASGALGKLTGGAVAKNAALYSSVRKGFTALIARATGERGVLTDADAARALELLPALNDSPELAAGKIAQLRQVFANAEARLSIPRGTTESNSDDTLSLLGSE